MPRKKHRKTQEIRERIYEKFGWSISEWARRRGFPLHAVFDVLYGRIEKAGRYRSAQILEKLSEDLDLPQLGLFARSLRQSSESTSKTSLTLSSRSPSPYAE